MLLNGLSLHLPMVNEQFSKSFSADALVYARRLKTSYGSILKAASASTGVPVDILVGFMIIENDEGDPTVKSYTCTKAKDATGDCYLGLMQMGAETAFDTIKWQAAKGLSDQERAVVEKYLPGFLKPLGLVGFLGSWKMKIYKALQTAEFGIWTGALHIAQLIQRTTDDNGNVRLDHVIVKYNRGAGNYIKEVVNSGLKNVDTATLAKKLPVAETRSYILKFVGIDGTIKASQAYPI
jgi:hypothetical protein